jgi:agmatinase
LYAALSSTKGADTIMPPSDHTGSEFLDLPPALAARETAGALVLPIPYEATTSYVRGTEGGPAAILAASTQVEFLDEIHRDEPCTMGIHTLPPLDCRGAPDEVVGRIEERLASLASEGRFILSLGGEHTITVGAVAGIARGTPDLTVVTVDAHGDLRDQYEGSPLSHACVARRIAERHPLVQVGIRSLSSEESAFIEAGGATAVFASAIASERGAAAGGPGRPAWIDAALSAVESDAVYLSFDLDGLDPSIMPAVGTPEPGGLLWYETLAFLEALFARKSVVAADIVELCPVPGLVAPDFLAARLAYKIAGHALRARPA